MRVLVTYGSKMGGTRGIAEAVGDELRTRGVEADVVPAEAEPPVAGHDAVVIGGSLYAMRWHKAARKYVKHNAKRLHEVPVWFFSSGPLDDSASKRDIPPVHGVKKLMDRVGSHRHMTFGGRMPEDAHGFPAGSMAKKHAGDWRDFDEIRAWTDDIVSELQPTPTG